MVFSCKEKVIEEKGQEKVLLEQLDSLNLLIKKEPQNIETLNSRALLYIELNNCELAIEDLLKSQSINGLNAVTRFYLGIAYFDCKSYSESIDAYNYAIRLDPYIPEFFVNRALAEAKHGNYSEALSDYELALEMNSSNLSALVNRAVFYSEKLNDHENSIKDWQRLVQISPIPQYYNGLGLEYKRNGNITNARKCFQRAIELDSNSIEYKYNLEQISGYQ